MVPRVGKNPRGSWVRHVGSADVHALDRSAIEGAPQGAFAFMVPRVGKNPRGSCFLALLLSVTACTPAPARYAGDTMGSTYEVVAARLPPGVSGADVERLIRRELDAAHANLSTWHPGGAAARFNATPGTDWQPVPPGLAAAAALAHDLSVETSGAFDVTVAPLVRAWGFGAGATPGATPSPAEISGLLSRAGYTRLEVRQEPAALRRSIEGVEIDLDGIAPGLVVDHIAAGLEALAVTDYLVEIGGEVRARGRSPAGRPWRVAVEAPSAAERRPYALVELDGRAVSTSGDYRDFRLQGGVRVSHTIDPRTGRPVTHSLASVTVVASTAARADAYATALMVLGPEAGAAYAREHRIAALFVERTLDGGWREYATPEFTVWRRPLRPRL